MTDTYTPGPVSDGGMDPRNRPGGSEDTRTTLRVVEQGEANEYALVSNGGTWVAAVRMQGEWMPQRQQEVLRAFAAAMGEEAVPVGSIHRTHLRQQIPGGKPWCRDALLYSPDNNADGPENRVMLYTAGGLSDRLDWLEKGIAEWRATADARGIEAERVRATARLTIELLRDILKADAPEARAQAQQRARDWLTIHGMED